MTVTMNWVINMAEKQLTQIETDLLTKSLNFFTTTEMFPRSKES